MFIVDLALGEAVPLRFALCELFQPTRTSQARTQRTQIDSWHMKHWRWNRNSTLGWMCSRTNWQQFMITKSRNEMKIETESEAEGECCCCRRMNEWIERTEEQIWVNEKQLLDALERYWRIIKREMNENRILLRITWQFYEIKHNITLTNS